MQGIKLHLRVNNSEPNELFLNSIHLNMDYYKSRVLIGFSTMDYS